MLYCSEKPLNVFCFLDRITELKKNESLTAVYRLSGSEEFLKDHFSNFPVMPGVLLLESLKQAASKLLAESKPGGRFYRLQAAQEVKFGQFVRPGSELKLSVRLLSKQGALSHLEGRADLVVNGSTLGKALSVRLTLAPLEAAN